MDKEYLTVAEAAKLIGMSKDTIYNGVKVGQFETTSKTKGRRTVTLIEKNSLLNFASKRDPNRGKRSKPKTTPEEDLPIRKAESNSIRKPVRTPIRKPVDDALIEYEDNTIVFEKPSKSDVALIEMYEKMLSREKEFSAKLEKEKIDLIEKHIHEKTELIRIYESEKQGLREQFRLEKQKLEDKIRTLEGRVEGLHAENKTMLINHQNSLAEARGSLEKEKRKPIAGLLVERIFRRGD